MNRTTRFALAAPLLGMSLALVGCSHPNPGAALMQGSWKFERVVVPTKIDAQLSMAVSNEEQNAWNNNQIHAFNGVAQQQALDRIAIRRYGKLLDRPILRFTANAIIESAGTGADRQLPVKSYTHKDRIYTAHIAGKGLDETFTYRLSADGKTLVRQLENGFTARYRHVSAN